MPQFSFKDLKDTYENFSDPIVLFEVGGVDVAKKGFAITEVEVSLTAGYEAGVATVYIGNVFDRVESSYKISDIKKVFLLGKTVELALGYGNTFRTVFKGFISQVGFTYMEKDMPLMRVTCMDIKGIMMNGNYNRQLTAKDYSGAVKEIFDKTNIKTLTDNSIYNLKITDTPDHKQSSGGDKDDASPFAPEMVNETDYEFVVRAAKKFNYEFFCIGSTVYFRRARDTSGYLLELSPEWLIKSFDVDYNITGLVTELEVRGVNPDKGEVIVAKRKLSNKFSLGSKVKPLLKGTSFVLQDATVNSDEDAAYRLDYLQNNITSRFANLDVEFMGIPEIIPGRFMYTKALTSDINDTFYINKVTHRIQYEIGYTTRIEAFAQSISAWS